MCVTPAEYEAEIARLHRFTLELAERLYLVAGQLSLLAERKEVRGTMALKVLEGKTIVWRRDPVFHREGWCILAGNIIVEMQTMEWVTKLIRRKGNPGDVLLVKDGILVMAKELDKLGDLLADSTELRGPNGRK